MLDDSVDTHVSRFDDVSEKHPDDEAPLVNGGEDYLSNEREESFRAEFDRVLGDGDRRFEPIQEELKVDHLKREDSFPTIVPQPIIFEEDGTDEGERTEKKPAEEEDYPNISAEARQDKKLLKELEQRLQHWWKIEQDHETLKKEHQVLKEEKRELEQKLKDGDERYDSLSVEYELLNKKLEEIVMNVTHLNEKTPEDEQPKRSSLSFGNLVSSAWNELTGPTSKTPTSSPQKRQVPPALPPRSYASGETKKQSPKRAGRPK